MNFGGEEIEATHPLICLLCEVASAVTPRCGACPTGCFTARRAARRFYPRPSGWVSSGGGAKAHAVVRSVRADALPDLDLCFGAAAARSPSGPTIGEPGASSNVLLKEPRPAETAVRERARWPAPLEPDLLVQLKKDSVVTSEHEGGDQEREGAVHCTTEMLPGPDERGASRY
jgi:hypothetical protein